MELAKMAYWIMRRAIDRNPNSAWAKEATDQWLHYCEKFEEKHSAA
jgi:hypothetical protein